MSNMEITFSEIDLACDVKEFASLSSDVTYKNEKLKEIIFKSNDSDLLKVTKTIASPIKIVAVEKVDEEYIEKNV